MIFCVFTGVTCTAPGQSDIYNSVMPGQSLSQCKNTVDVSDPAWKVVEKLE